MSFCCSARDALFAPAPNDKRQQEDPYENYLRQPPNKGTDWFWAQSQSEGHDEQSNCKSSRKPLLLRRGATMERPNGDDQHRSMFERCMIHFDNVCGEIRESNAR
jgi:hypothetical protein